MAHKLTWTRREVPLTDLDDFNQMLAVNETGAHLDVLVARGHAVARRRTAPCATRRPVTGGG